MRRTSVFIRLIRGLIPDKIRPAKSEPVLTNYSKGKLSGKDATTARLLKIAPWIAVLAASLPAPLVFVVLFLTAAATETAAVYLFLAGLSLVFGFALGVVIAAILLLYRRSWLAKLRNRLASDGITANEVVWFRSELTSAERKALAEMEESTRCWPMLTWKHWPIASLPRA